MAQLMFIDAANFGYRTNTSSFERALNLEGPIACSSVSLLAMIHSLLWENLVPEEQRSLEPALEEVSQDTWLQLATSISLHFQSVPPDFLVGFEKTYEGTKSEYRRSLYPPHLPPRLSAGRKVLKFFAVAPKYLPRREKPSGWVLHNIHFIQDPYKETEFNEARTLGHVSRRDFEHYPVDLVPTARLLTPESRSWLSGLPADSFDGKTMAVAYAYYYPTFTAPRDDRDEGLHDYILFYATKRVPEGLHVEPIREIPTALLEKRKEFEQKRSRASIDREVEDIAASEAAVSEVIDEEALMELAKKEALERTTESEAALLKRYRETSYKKELESSKIGAQRGNLKDVFHLACPYMGLGSTEQLEQSVDLLKLLADMGDRGMQVYLAKTLKKLNKDLVLSRRYFGLGFGGSAYDSSYLSAYIEMLLNGEGGPRDLLKAYRWATVKIIPLRREAEETSKFIVNRASPKDPELEKAEVLLASITEAMKSEGIEIPTTTLMYICGQSDSRWPLNMWR